MNNHLEKLLKVMKNYVSDEELHNAHSQILKSNSNNSMSMKVLTIIGGFLSTIAFLAFMFISHVFDSGQAMFIFGIACIAVSYFIHYKKENLIFETVSVTLYMAGYILFSSGLLEMKMDESLLCCILIIMSLISIITINNRLLIFLSVLLLNASFFALYNLKNITQLFYIHLSIITVIVYIMYFFETYFLSQSTLIKRIYHPIRIGFSFMFLFSFIGFQLYQNMLFSQYYLYILSLTILFCNLWLLYNILHKMNFSLQWQLYAVLIVIILLLAPTFMHHGIAASLLLMLLCYYAQYSMGIIISAIMFVYYISRFYYDMHYSLILKSIILMFSGLLFLIFYFITRKYFTINEKV